MCDHYKCLPTEVERLTFDQLFIVTAKIEDLQALGVVKMSLAQARAAGLIKDTSGKSYVQRIKERRAREREEAKKLSKRERRRAYDERIRAMRKGS